MLGKIGIRKRHQQRNVTGGTKCRSYNVESAKPSGHKLIQNELAGKGTETGLGEARHHFWLINILPQTMACRAVRSNQGLSYHFMLWQQNADI